MDRLDDYRQILQNVLDSYARIPNSYEPGKNSVVDREQSNFYWCTQAGKGLKEFTYSGEFIEGKIWIKHGIETGISTELVELEVPKDKIVLGFHPYHVRQRDMRSPKLA